MVLLPPSFSTARSVVPQPLHLWIVILNWRGIDDTIACVESVLSQDGLGETRIVVCDNASGDGSLDRLQAFFDGRRPGRVCTLSESEVLTSAPFGQGSLAPVAYLVANIANHGYAGGNNVGVRLALRDPAMSHVLILNNDTMMEPGCLRALVAHLEQRPQQGLTGCTLVYADTPGRLQAAGGGRHRRWSGRSLHYGQDQPRATAITYRDRPPDYVHGAAMVISRACLEEAGLMDESLFLYYEEIDYARRVRRRFALGYCHDAVIRHKEGGSTGGKRQAVSALAEFYMIRNRLRIAWRHYPYALPTVMAWLIVPILRHALAGRLSRAALILRAATIRARFKPPRTP
jgi:GT2 family glycosyltransferase